MIGPRGLVLVGARTLLVLFDSAYLLALTAWVGGILFFSFGVAPILFKVLDAASAARFVRALFPRYYAWGANWGAVALAALVCGVLTHPELRGPAVAVQVAVIVGGILAMFYSGNTLTPAINAARDAGPDQKSRFDRLHRRSVRLNGLVLLAGVGLLAAYAARPATKTAGIVEPTQREWSERDANRFFKAQKSYEEQARPKPTARPGRAEGPGRPAPGPGR